MKQTKHMKPMRLTAMKMLVSTKTRLAITSLVVAILALMATQSAVAMTYLGKVVSDNDPFPGDLKLTIGEVEIDSPALAKWENGSWDPDSLEGYSSLFTVDGGDGYSGEWTFTPASGFLEPHYLVVKASNEYAVWEITAAERQADGSLAGTWETTHLVNGGGNQPDLSHLSFYNTGSEVPLPAAAWLFGSAMLGLAGIGYRRKAKDA